MKDLSIMENPEKLTLANSSTVKLSQLIKIKDLQHHDVFEKLFPLDEKRLAVITEKMRVKGYDQSQPIAVWSHECSLILIDGHHREKAAIANGYTEIPAYIHHFLSIDEAAEYAYSLQKNRRNSTDAELQEGLKILDTFKLRGRGSKGDKGKSAERTAKLLGTSTTKVEKLRFINKNGSTEIQQAVADNTLSIHQAYLKAKEFSAEVPIIRIPQKSKKYKTLEEVMHLLIAENERNAIRIIATRMFPTKTDLKSFCSLLSNENIRQALVEILKEGGEI